MAENRAKPRFPRTLFSPFAFCKPHKLISDVVHTPLITPHSSTSLEPLLPPPSPPPKSPYPSLCKPRCPKNLHQMVNQHCILSSLHYQKLSPSLKCPPPSPITPITDSDIESPETLFSTSTSSSSRSSRRTRRRPPSARRREARRKAASLDENDKEGKTFAVVRSSIDPYTDFRASMAEMIMENNIFNPIELEQLLRCYLSLNSPYHHLVIVEVFAEICDALFFQQFGV